jgi:hypothetical protein
VLLDDPLRAVGATRKRGYRYVDGRGHYGSAVEVRPGDVFLGLDLASPRGETEAIRYVDTALAWRDAGTAVPFAIVREVDGIAIGSTRFWNLERWSWPEGHPSQGRSDPDACEQAPSRWLAEELVDGLGERGRGVHVEHPADQDAGLVGCVGDLEVLARHVFHLALTRLSPATRHGVMAGGALSFYGMN